MDEPISIPSSGKDLEKALFEVALNLKDRETREAFLSQACAMTPALRARIEELLSASAIADDFLEATLSRGKTDARQETEPEAEMEKPELEAGVDTRIGRYRLLERLGEG